MTLLILLQWVCFNYCSSFLIWGKWLGFLRHVERASKKGEGGGDFPWCRCWYVHEGIKVMRHSYLSPKLFTWSSIFSLCFMQEIMEFQTLTTQKTQLRYVKKIYVYVIVLLSVFQHGKSFCLTFFCRLQQCKAKRQAWWQTTCLRFGKFSGLLYIISESLGCVHWSMRRKKLLLMLKQILENLGGLVGYAKMLKAWIWLNYRF